MINWSDEQIIEAGLDPKKVESITRRLNKLGREMDSMGLSIYGASGSGHLIHVSRPTHTEPRQQPDYESSIANLDGCMVWDGGDW